VALIAGLIAVLGYVLVYGGELQGVGVAAFWLFGLAVSSISLYLAYRFVLAVELIAQKL
jgi:hypothetical protein